jgi:hypothetical protein
MNGIWTLRNGTHTFRPISYLSYLIHISYLTYSTHFRARARVICYYTKGSHQGLERLDVRRSFFESEHEHGEHESESESESTAAESESKSDDNGKPHWQSRRWVRLDVCLFSFAAVTAAAGTITTTVGPARVCY